PLPIRDSATDTWDKWPSLGSPAKTETVRMAAGASRTAARARLDYVRGIGRENPIAMSANCRDVGRELKAIPLTPKTVTSRRENPRSPSYFGGGPRKYSSIAVHRTGSISRGVLPFHEPSAFWSLSSRATPSRYHATFFAPALNSREPRTCPSSASVKSRYA